jgi:hypothetical protein
MDETHLRIPTTRAQQPVRSAYQPPANSTFLSQQTSHQQPASSTLLSEQTSTSHQPPANRTGLQGSSHHAFTSYIYTTDLSSTQKRELAMQINKRARGCVCSHRRWLVRRARLDRSNSKRPGTMILGVVGALAVWAASFLSCAAVCRCGMQCTQDSKKTTATAGGLGHPPPPRRRWCGGRRRLVGAKRSIDGVYVQGAAARCRARPLQAAAFVKLAAVAPAGVVRRRG